MYLTVHTRISTDQRHLETSLIS